MELSCPCHSIEVIHKNVFVKRGSPNKIPTAGPLKTPKESDGSKLGKKRDEMIEIECLHVENNHYRETKKDDPCLIPFL